MELTNMQTSKNKDNKTYQSVNRYGYDYDYDNILHSEKQLRKLNREQIKNRKITMLRTEMTLCDNSISTSKYNYFNFIPKNLIEQFSKIANLYFLVSYLFEELFA